MPQVWRDEQDIAPWRDPEVARQVVQEVDHAGVEDRSRLEVVREGLMWQFRHHNH